MLRGKCAIIGCSIVFFDAGQHQTIGCRGSIQRAGLILDVSKDQGGKFFTSHSFLKVTLQITLLFAIFVPIRVIIEKSFIITNKVGASNEVSIAIIACIAIARGS